MKMNPSLLITLLLVASCETLRNSGNGDSDPEDNKPVPEEGTGESNGYSLVWQDLFNEDALDESIWNIEVNGDGGGNAELQYYRRENVSVGEDSESGRNCLIITAKKESFGGKSFTSGRVNTRGNKAFTYGKVEACIKLPSTSDGLWPAFWMMGDNYDELGWPRCGEIDILEMGNSQGIKTSTQDRFFNGACHWGYYKEVSPNNWAYPNYAKSSVWDYSLQDGQFHLFTLIWDKNSLKMYVDMDKYPSKSPYFEMGITSKDDDWGVGHYFHHDFFILFNMAVGGHFTGILNPDAITALPEGQAEMYVDYVKVYQKR